MAFSGWSPEAVEFFQELRDDNTKAYWSAHKDFYEAVAPWLYTAEAKHRVAGFLRTAAPLHQWLDQRVGPDPA